MKRLTCHPNPTTVEEDCTDFFEGRTTAPTYYRRGTVVLSERGSVWAVSAVPKIIAKGATVVLGQYNEDHFFVVDVKP